MSTTTQETEQARQGENPSEEYGVTVPVTIYVDDLDGYGMVHHARYAVLLDHALTDFWSAAGYPLDGSTGIPVVRRLDLGYRRPITAAGRVDVRMWVTETRTSSALYRFEVRSPDGTLHVEAERLVINLDPATLRPAPFPAEQWRMAAPLLAPGAGPALA